MQTTTKRYMDAGLPGQLALSGEPKTEPMFTGFIGQVSRFTIGDAPYVDTTYTVSTVVTPGITVTGPGEAGYDGSDAADATAAAVGFAAAWNVDPKTRALGIASVNVAKSVDIAWIDYTRSWAPMLSTADAATFTAAVQTPASSSTARMGVFVTRGAATGDPRAARLLTPLTNATVIGDVRGAVIREDAGVEQTSLTPSPDSFDAYPAGRPVAVLNSNNAIWVPCETAMAVDGPIFIRKSGTGINGAIRNDADGGTAINASSIAAIIKAGVAGGCACVKVHIPL